MKRHGLRVLFAAGLMTLPLVSFCADATPGKVRPGFVDCGTFEESAVDFIDRNYAWELAWDAVTCPNLVGVRNGAWYATGPFKVGSQESRAARSRITAEELAAGGCKNSPIRWRAVTDVSHDCINRVSPGVGMETIYAHVVDVLDDVGVRDDYACNIGISHPERPWGAYGPQGVNRGLEFGPDRRVGDYPATSDTATFTFEPPKPGTRVVYLLAVAGAPDTGKATFYFNMRYRNLKKIQRTPPGSSWSRHYDVARLLASGAAAAYASNAVASAMMSWSQGDGLWRVPNDFTRFPHELKDDFLDRRLRCGIRRAANRVTELLCATQGVEKAYLAPYRARFGAAPEAWSNAALRVTGRARVLGYHRLCALDYALRTACSLRTAADAVNDLAATFGAAYPKKAAYLARLAALGADLEKAFAALEQGATDAVPQAVATCLTIDAVRDRILLDNPLIRRHPLVMTRGDVWFASNWYPSNRIGNELLMYDLSGDEPKETVLKRGVGFSDYNIHWDAKRILYADGVNLHELTLGAGGVSNTVRQVTKAEKVVNHYDGCYLPSGKIVCCCNACYQTVPCVGAWDVGNLHILDADGTNERRVTFDQDHDWNPTVMEDGRVMFSRWEYADTPHYFTRLIMRMNPDGSSQMEFYGSNSYWPNSTFWPLQIPGEPHRFVAIVSGHHGTSRSGFPVIFDVSRGRQETSGVVQRLPGRDKTVRNEIKDGLVNDIWPKYAATFPLADGPDNKGAGRYFLASRKLNADSGWDLVLMDAFDNVTVIRRHRPGKSYMTGKTLRVRPVPRVIPDKIDTAATNATIYLVNIYEGDGLKHFPKGSIKKLRVGTFNYRYFGNGSTYTCAYEGSWDCRKILGTVPVEPDGSALFHVPANTPVYVQPLDAEGKAQALMRSWYNAMPGEVGSCVGCHESQNAASPAQLRNQAALRAPSEPAPWNGKPVRMFDYEADVQPLLNRKCVGCHDSEEAEEKTGRPDFRDKRVRRERQDEIPKWTSIGKVPENPGWLANQNRHLKEDGKFFSPAYMRLQRYVRRAGLEADYHLLPPAEFEADTSYLVKMLKKGHHGVTLTQADWDILYTWIDQNVPYHGRWTDCALPPNPEHIVKRKRYAKLYWNTDDHDEDPIPVPPIAAFEAPSAKPAKTVRTAAMEQVTVTPADFKPSTFDVTTPKGTKIPFCRIPAGSFTAGSGDYADEPLRKVTIAKGFALMQREVSNALFNEFDPKHDSRYMDARGKDRVSRGIPMNVPSYAVIRITRREAEAFCAWLSAKTGKACSLPTEDEWEWACRAGLPFANCGYKTFNSGCANLCGREMWGYNFGTFKLPGYGMADWQDGGNFNTHTDRGRANAWGLHDMIGNVAEWTASDWLPGDARKVVRGGSWNDVRKFATPASRWRYEEYKGVYDVGFRVKIAE